MKSFTRGLYLFYTSIFFAAYAGAAPPPATHAADPVWAELKAFRTYFSIDSYQPTKHNFVIWYKHDGFGSKARVNVDTEAEAAKVKSLGGGFVAGSLSVPSPLPFSEVPAALEPVADAIKKQIEVLRPGSSDFVVRYMGRYSNFQLKEVIAEDDTADVFNRRARNGEYDVKLADKSDHLEPDFGMAGSGSSFLCRPWDAKSCVTSPDFVDYSLPAALEGSGLLAAHYFYTKKEPAEYKAAFDTFEAAVVKMVRAMDAGTYANPIQDILKRQGPTVLPAGFNQPLEFEVSAYGYPKGGGGTVSKRMKIALKLNDLLAGEVKVQRKVPELGLVVDMVFNWKNETIEVVASHDSGAGGKIDLVFDSSRLITDGPRQAVRSYVSVEGKPTAAGKPGETKLRLKAPGTFSEILVSTDTDISYSTIFFETE